MLPFRLVTLSLAVMIVSCGSIVRSPNLPASVAPAWTRGAVERIDTSRFPALMKSAGTKDAWRTEYRTTGGATAAVTVYAISSATQGLDLVQRWRPERDAAQFYTEHFLLNVAWKDARHDELAELVRNLPKIVEGP